MAGGRAPSSVTLHRFFLPPACIQGDHVSFPPAVAHQLHRVLRLRPGKTVLALDGSGAEYVTRLDTVGADTRGIVVERRMNTAEPPRPLVLYQGLVKGSKFETIVEHCTEVGVTRFVPMVTRRSVAAEPSASRQRRFDTIAREAAEQSARGIIPVVDLPMPFADAVSEACECGPAYLPYEGAHGSRLQEETFETSAGAVSLLIGPEGGFDEAEVALAASSGISIVTLGPRILRAETAAIVASALVVSTMQS